MKALKKIFTGLGILLALAFITRGVLVYAAARTTANLRADERNLEILADKDGSLHQLIEELQRNRVTFATVTTPSVTGSSVVVPGLSTGDRILAIVVHSSANNVSASSVTVRQAVGDGTFGASVTIRANVWGNTGNNVLVTFTQNTTTTALRGQLQVVTTGYNIEVKLSTGDVAAYYSSAPMVCAAINNNPAAAALVNCSFQASVATMTAMPITQFALNGGAGAPLSRHVLPSAYYTVTSSQAVTISTGAPLMPNDGLEINWLDAIDE